MKIEPQITESERQSAVRYLLGAMTDAERSAFEESGFSNDRSVEMLEAVRDELIDEYLDGNLSPADRARFENYFLISPHHLRKVEFTRSIREIVAETALPATQPTHEESFWQRISPALLGSRSRVATVALVALVIVCGAAVYVFRRSHPTPIEPLQMVGVTTNQTTPTAPDSEAEVNTDAKQQSAHQNRHSAANSPVRDAERIPERRGAHTITFSLHSVVRGSEKARPLVVPAQASAVRLVVDRPADGYARHCALLSTVEGQEIWRLILGKLPPVEAEGKVIITIPSDLLSSEDYTLRIIGIKASGEEETVSHYYFRIIKRSAAGR